MRGDWQSSGIGSSCGALWGFGPAASCAQPPRTDEHGAGTCNRKSRWDQIVGGEGIPGWASLGGRGHSELPGFGFPECHDDSTRIRCECGPRRERRARIRWNRGPGTRGDVVRPCVLVASGRRTSAVHDRRVRGDRHTESLPGRRLGNRTGGRPYIGGWIEHPRVSEHGARGVKRINRGSAE